MQSGINGSFVPVVHHIAVKNLLAGLEMVHFAIASGKRLELHMKQMELTCCTLLVIG